MMLENKIAVLPIRNAVAFPGVTFPFLVKRAGSVAAIRAAQAADGYLLILTQRQDNDEDPAPGDLYTIGTLAKIERITGNEKTGFQLVTRGLSRYRANSIQREEYLIADGARFSDRTEDNPEAVKILFQNLKRLCLDVLELLPGETSQLARLLSELEDPAYLTFLTAAYLDLPLAKKQELLENTSVHARLLELLDLVQKQKEALTLKHEIEEKMAKKLGKNQREAMLREQLKTIREELGDDESAGADDLRSRIEQAHMPEEVRKIAEQELKRLEAIGAASPESHVIRNYIDWLIAMPWDKSTTDTLDIEAAQKILDEDHAGLEKIKRRILEHLAVMKLKQEVRGSILCFVGPPGVGKTSLGQSIARALGRKFIRTSLGGVRDEAEIRGHRRTYIGAMPGRIIQSIKRAGEKNPVFMLDEIDKLSFSFQGDPASALLEVLDPEQNKSFVDHYLDVPFDLSNVFFIATANTLDTIPAPLRDRMEIIELSGYTVNEKLEIAKRYLAPRQLKEHGLKSEQLSFSDKVLAEIITEYTREAGVRQLNRCIGAVCRAAAVRVLKASTKFPIEIESSWLDDILGYHRFEPEVSERELQPGVVTGLAWTPHGGEILFIEAQAMPGKGNLIITGQLGDVMKESAQIALSLVRSKLSVFAPQFEYDKKDIHVHVPAGAIPKDGPSAGITMVTAIASLVSGRIVDSSTAMTGEITLRGAVLPVGGVKEKILAAHRAGIKRIILSRRNQKDLREVPQEVRSALKFTFVESAAEVLKETLSVDAFGPAPLSGSGGELHRHAVA